MNAHKKQISQLNAGFTLIELLVIVVIIGILGSIAAPGWLGFLDNQRVGNVRSDLRNVLLDAQSDAKQRSSDRTIIFKTTSDGPVVEVGSSAGATLPQLLGDNAESIQLTSFISSTAGVASIKPADRVVFDYRGGIPADSVPFVINVSSTDSARQKCLVITTILGGIAEANGDDCDNPLPTP